MEGMGCVNRKQWCRKANHMKNPTITNISGAGHVILAHLDASWYYIKECAKLQGTFLQLHRDISFAQQSFPIWEAKQAHNREIPCECSRFEPSDYLNTLLRWAEPL